MPKGLWYFLCYILNSVFAALDTLSPWYILICLIPVCLSGGFSSYLTGVLCHITDSTNENNRGMKMGIFDATLFLGIFLGTLSSSYLFIATNYATVFLLAATCCLLSLLLTIFLVPESLSNRESEGHLTELFQFTNIKDMVKITFKRRPDYARYTVICNILLMILAVVIINGNAAVAFLFLREKFHWSLKKYTLFVSFSSFVSVLGTIGGVYILHKLLKIPETILILASLLSSLNGVLLMGLAENDWIVYVAPLAKFLDGIFGPMARSLVSKVVPNEEVGKIFALVTTSQSLFGLIGSPLYTVVYDDTININPALFNFVTAGIYVFSIFVAITVIGVRTAKGIPDVSRMLDEENRHSNEEELIV